MPNDTITTPDASDLALANSAPSNPINQKGTLRGSLASFLGAVLLLMTFRWLIAEPYVIPSGSMIPTLLIHDHILVNKMAFGLRWPFTKKWVYSFAGPERGDVVVFRSIEDDGFFMVKRIIGLPGDRLSYSAQGELSINGQVVPQELLKLEELQTRSQGYRHELQDLNAAPDSLMTYRETLPGGRTHLTLLTKSEFRWSQDEIIVPEGQYFAMGDNRDNSRDSRAWGTFPTENLLGRAIFVWLSCAETLPNAPYLCNPSTMRWGRLFHRIR